jgi:hypothetical protein
MKIIDPTIRNEYLINYLNDSQMKFWVGKSKDSTDKSNIDFVFRVTNYDPTNEKKRQRKESPKFDYRTTFGELDGLPIHFPNLNRPFNRCLNLQAKLAVYKAEKEMLIAQNSIQIQDFWSEVDLSEKLQTIGFFDN